MVTTVCPSEGLSPRGRGNPPDAVDHAVADGSIPAWAGEPRRSARSSGGGWVYPRVGGGTARLSHLLTRATGLSPRGRGNRDCWYSVSWTRWSIPAWAGEPIFRRRSFASSWVYPRVGGGTANTSIGLQNTDGLSPRGRGNRRLIPEQVPLVRSIPAWAGEPPRSPPCPRLTTVYPRVGGGTELMVEAEHTALGLSPRGRGNLLWGCRTPNLIRSIPAWAGEPGTIQSQWVIM